LNGVFNPSRIRSNNGREYQFTCAMWRVHPRTREFQVVCEGTSNPYGIAWDKEGSAIVEACHWANDHLFHFVETGYYQRQAGAYPPFTFRLGSITDHGHQKTAYCGISYFDSDAYPESFREKIYVGNIHGGCINVDRLERDGSTYLAKAEADFLSANDVWFMPVAQKVGPDGCLYILDWYDQYHCYQDANRDPEGIDRLKGRLYRVRYGEAPRAPRIDLANERDEKLIERLASPNIFFREKAQRILSERSHAELRERLQHLVLDFSAPRKARLHAFWTLISQGNLPPSFHEQMLAHTDATFRAWAVRAAGNMQQIPPGIAQRVAALARDPSPDVQLQVVIASRKISGMDALPVLMEVLEHCRQDKLIPAIAWQNLHPLLAHNSARFADLLENGPASPALRLLMPRVIDRWLGAAHPDPQAVAKGIEWISKHDSDSTKACLSALAARWPEMNGSMRDRLKANLQPILERLIAIENDPALKLTAELLADWRSEVFHRNPFAPCSSISASRMIRVCRRWKRSWPCATVIWLKSLPNY
jgi:hypothetical protein